MRRLMLFTIGFCIACALFAYFHISWLWIAAIVAIFLAVVLFLIGRKHVWIGAIATILLGCAVGCGWTELYSVVYLSTSAKLDMKTEHASITVTDYSYDTDYGVASDGIVYLDNKPYSVKFYIDSSEQLKPGDTVSGNFRFRLTTGDGAEDPTYHRSEGKFLLLYDDGDVLIKKSDASPWYCRPAVWRNKLLSQMEQLFSEDTVGFAQALVLGERNKLDYETQTALKVSGIQHVVAVSGLHVSILFGLLQVFTWKKRLINLLVVSPILLLFAAIVGFTPSVTRACVMQILIMLAEVTFKDYDPPTALAFSVLVMVTVNPMAITSVSLQLSAGCVIGIIMLYSRIKNWIQGRKWYGSAEGKGVIPKLKRWVTSSVSMTISAMVPTTPFVAWYFGMVSLVGVFTNLLTLWCISFIFYGIVACCGLSIISLGLAGFLAKVISLPIRYVLYVAKLCSKVPFAAVYTKSIYIIIWLFVCYVLLFVFLMQKRKHPFLLLSCCTALLLVAMFVSWLEPRLYTTYATFLDVGQGQCIILQSGGRTFLVDCGGSSDTDAADEAAETLLSRGISRVDGIILTHYDRDHVGGVEYLLTRIRADYIYLPHMLDKSSVGDKIDEKAEKQSILVKEDLDVEFSSGKLRIFAPEAYDLGNESGICVLFQTENCDILITGDRGELGEMFLLHYHDLPEVDVLVAGHHGSAGSTSDRLLSKTKPDTVVISVSERNPYGHPSEALLDRLMLLECEIFRTDLHGTILCRR